MACTKADQLWASSLQSSTARRVVLSERNASMSDAVGFPAWRAPHDPIKMSQAGKAALEHASRTSPPKKTAPHAAARAERRRRSTLVLRLKAKLGDEDFDIGQ